MSPSIPSAPKPPDKTVTFAPSPPPLTPLLPQTSLPMSPSPSMNSQVILDVSTLEARPAKQHMFILAGFVGSQPAKGLLDSGSGGDFISEEYATRHSLKTSKRPPYQIKTALGELVWRDTEVTSMLQLPGATISVPFKLAPLASYDFILGRPFILKHVQHLNVQDGTIALHNGLTISGGGTEGGQEMVAVLDVGESFLCSDREMRDLLSGGHYHSAGLIDVIASEDNSFNLAVLDESGGLAKFEGPPPGSEATSESHLPHIGQSGSQHQQILQLLERHKHRFRAGIPKPSQSTHLAEGLLETGDAIPRRSATRPMSPAMLAELRARIKELLDKGYITPSKSASSSPVLFVKKHDGSYRMCVDYRAVNSVTLRDGHPLPRISECLDQLSDCRYFSKLDFCSGFHQMGIPARDSDKTAFVCPYGQYQWKVMPFGLKNAPAAFQRFMHKVLSPFIDKFMVVYLDDILIFSRTWQDHVDHVTLVLQAIEQADLYLNWKKCVFGVEEVDFVGHRVSAAGVKPLQDKLAAIKEWPRPQTVHDVRAFLGLASYYRRFVVGFAKTTAPLYELLKGQQRKFAPTPWQPLHEAAFVTIKEALTSAPTLATVRTGPPFIMRSDASDVAIGCELVQLQPDGSYRPVAFESRKLQPAERKYPTPEKELLALLYGWTKWNHYLEGAEDVTIECDHHPLQFLHSKKKLSARLERWIDAIAAVDAKITYKPGVDLTVPDLLSRRADYLDLNVLQCDSLHPSDWPLLLTIQDQRQLENFPSQAVTSMRRHKDEFLVEGSHMTFIGPDANERSPFVPFMDRGTLLDELHRGYGHQSQHGMLALLQGRGWWPGRRKDVDSYCGSCPECQSFGSAKHKQEHAPPIIQSPITKAFSRWGIDFIRLPKHRSGLCWILTMVCHATGWGVAVPMKKASKERVAEAIYHHIVLPYGVPDEILSDRGANFVAPFVASFLRLLNIKQLKTSAYHPRTNGKTERFNGILENYLFKLNTTGDPSMWPLFLPQALFATRVRQQRTSGFSPFELVYGQKPRLPLDDPVLSAPVSAEISEEQAVQRQQHVEDMRQQAGRSYVEQQRRDAVARTAKLAANPQEFQEGDLVLVRNEERTKGQPAWFGTYSVAKQLRFGTYLLKTPDGRILDTPYNINRLKPAKTKDGVPVVWHLPPSHSGKSPPVKIKLKIPSLRDIQSRIQGV